MAKKRKILSLKSVFLATVNSHPLLILIYIRVRAVNLKDDYYFTRARGFHSSSTIHVVNNTYHRNIVSIYKARLYAVYRNSMLSRALLKREMNLINLRARCIVIQART